MARSSGIALCVLLSTPVWAQKPLERAPGVIRQIAPDGAVSATMLVKASDGVAVIRVATGALEKVKVGDLVGTTKAVVKEISAGRLVVEETFTGNDGKPNRALIVIKEGERGGTRYLQRADEPRFTGTKPSIVTPTAPDTAKPSPKKPPPM